MNMQGFPSQMSNLLYSLSLSNWKNFPKHLTAYNRLKYLGYVQDQQAQLHKVLFTNFKKYDYNFFSITRKFFFELLMKMRFFKYHSTPNGYSTQKKLTRTSKIL